MGELYICPDRCLSCLLTGVWGAVGAVYGQDLSLIEDHASWLQGRSLSPYGTISFFHLFLPVRMLVLTVFFVVPVNASV